MERKLGISNLLSLFRLAAAPVIMFAVIFNKLYFAFILFIIAAFTDLLDGYVARRLKEESRLGEILDRVADKLLIGFPFIGILIKYSMINWLIIFGFIIVLYIVAGSIFLKCKHKPILLGRALISLQAITLVFLVLDFPYKWTVLWIVIILTTIVGFFYIYRLIRKT
jgi:phosphatidylglycerophosphate synthase